MLTNKVFFHLFNRALAQPLPTATLVGLADKGRFLPLGGGSLEAAQARWGALVVKPVAGAGGRGVRLAASPAEALAGAEKEIALIESPIEPHAYAAAIFPGARSTRSALIDLPRGRGRAVHRRGGASLRCFGTAPVDSFKAAACRRWWSSTPGAYRSPILVEGNARVPNTNLVQVDRPLLCDAPPPGFSARRRSCPEWRFRRLEKATREAGAVAGPPPPGAP